MNAIMCKKSSMMKDIEANESNRFISSSSMLINEELKSIKIRWLNPDVQFFLPQSHMLKLSSRIAISKWSQLNRTLFTSSYQLAQIPFLLADIGEGIAEVEVLQWHVKEGDIISQFDLVCEVQSDKANVDITSRYDGKIVSLGYKVGDMAKVGSPLLIIDSDVTASASISEPAPKKQETPVPSKPIASPIVKPVITNPVEHESIHISSDSTRSLAVPAVRRIAMEHNINIQSVKGSGKDGRVMKEDILNYINAGQKQSVEKTLKKEVVSPIIFPPVTASDTVIPVRGMTRLMVSSMKSSLTIPHFGYCDEYEFDALHKAREELKAVSKEKGLKLSYMPFVIKAASLALKQYPILNSSLSSDESEIRIHGSHNIGVAMDTPRGLLVPCINNVQEKSIFEVAQELVKLQELGAVNKLGEKELKGTTFSLSNIGAIGGTYAKPVIVPPQVAIGAIGKIQTLPRFDVNMNVKPVRIVQFSWAADHRVIDGATMARYSNLLKRYLENPASMIFELK